MTMTSCEPSAPDWEPEPGAPLFHTEIEGDNKHLDAEEEQVEGLPWWETKQNRSKNALAETVKSVKPPKIRKSVKLSKNIKTVKTPPLPNAVTVPNSSFLSEDRPLTEPTGIACCEQVLGFLVFLARSTKSICTVVGQVLYLLFLQPATPTHIESTTQPKAPTQLKSPTQPKSPTPLTDSVLYVSRHPLFSERSEPFTQSQLQAIDRLDPIIRRLQRSGRDYYGSY